MSERKPIFSVTIHPRWADQDSYGHINNVAYFRYIEEARAQWFLTLGHALDGAGAGPVVVDCGSNYRREWRHPHALEVRGFVAAIGNSSFTIEHEMWPADGGELVTTGHSKLVWFDHETRRSAPLPPALRELLQQSL